MQKELNRLGKLGSCNKGCGVPHNFERPTCHCDKKLESITVVDEKIAVLFDDGSYLLADKDILSESLVCKTVFDPTELEARLTAFATKTELDNYVAKSDLVTVRNLENTQDLFKAISVGA